LGFETRPIGDEKEQGKTEGFIVIEQSDVQFMVQ
jgi:hypothetical protein